LLNPHNAPNAIVEKIMNKEEIRSVGAKLKCPV
jgi:hypothetical protein